MVRVKPRTLPFLGQVLHKPCQASKHRHNSRKDNHINFVIHTNSD